MQSILGHLKVGLWETEYEQSRKGGASGKTRGLNLDREPDFVKNMMWRVNVFYKRKGKERYLQTTCRGTAV